ncbi:cytidylyltransferase domain-containing protein [Saccharibacillus deserti]|uniref:cytidylyltransferase domain-containing protein n=1 Tax=Saccharibacillus deserti TaxID=1634444 RepID=UPI001556DBB3|nr:glycosyltransferase family protein [Saccharibacillus deserti]
MRVTAIIQARMGSTRLPGKVMKKLGDRTVLGHVINRCQAIPSVTQVIVATTTSAEDSVICEEAEMYGVPYYKGSEENVLSRYYEAAKTFQAEVVVRITSDCPLLDPQISHTVIEEFLKSGCDYASSGLSETFPRGMDTEVFSFEALEESYQHASESFEKEHVTPYIYLHPDRFKLKSFSNGKDLSGYRLTLDTEEDWNLISKIYNELYQGEIFGLPAVLKLFAQYPKLPLMNKDIKQKKLGE